MALIKVDLHEYKIIEYFLHHQDKVITRTELVEHIYDQDLIEILIPLRSL